MLPLPVPPVLGDVVLAPEGLVPPLELEPGLLKWASHSWREIWPSPFLSTDEKLGWEPLLEALPLEVEGEADGEDGEALLPDGAGSAATASVERATSAAAVVRVTVLIIGVASMGWGKRLIAASGVPG